jgi:hypothetical protein
MICGYVNKQEKRAKINNEYKKEGGTPLTSLKGGSIRDISDINGKPPTTTTC